MQAFLKGVGRISTIKSLQQKGLSTVMKKISMKEGDGFKYSPAWFAGW
jgi:hypothetical protein